MKQRGCRRLPSLLLFAALVTTGAFVRAADPAALQRDAIAKIEAVADHFRKTFDYTSRIADLADAERQLRTSVEGFDGRGDLANVALSLIWLGQIQRMQGKWDAAGRYYEQAESAARKANHPAHEAKALMGRAKTADGLRDYGSAEAHVEQAVRLATSVEDKTYLFDALDILAQVQMQQGNFNAAADSLNRAFALPGIKDELLYYGYLDRSDVYLKLAEKCDYQRNFDACFQALDRTREDLTKALGIAQKLGWAGLAKQTEGFLREADARAALIGSRKRLHESLAKAKIFHPEKPSDVLVTKRFVGEDLALPPELDLLYKQSKRFEAQAGGFGNSVAATSLHTDGLMQQSRGDHAGALSSFMKAVAMLEQDRRKLQDDKARGTFVENKIGIYYAAILELLDKRRYDEAFELMEQSRARAMAEMLASRQLNLPGGEQQLYTELVRLRTAIAVKQADLFRLINAAAKPDALAPVGRDIAALEDAYRKLAARISAEAPQLQELTTSRAVSLRDLQERMRRDDFELLEYLVTENGVILWHIDASGVRVRNVFLPRSELLAKVEALQKSLSDRNDAFDRKTARELYLFLIQPVAGAMRSERLVIVPHDALHLLPFQVLENPADGSSLGERYRLSYAPSTTIQMGLRASAVGSRKTLLAAADPGIEAENKEVESIAQLYSGRSSKVILDTLIKESDVKAAVGDYEIVHLSVHGKFNGEEPMLSHLKLAKGAQDDGLLTAAEMFGLPLGKTSLVVLSACETGKAEATYSNEVLGMLRALLYAGASTVVVSYWKVDSASTALWMETFHRAAQASSAAEAARQALRAVKKRPEYAHPYFWSAFMLVTK